MTIDNIEINWEKAPKNAKFLAVDNNSLGFRFWYTRCPEYNETIGTFILPFGKTEEYIPSNETFYLPPGLYVRPYNK